MRASAIAGLILANSNDTRLSRLTAGRTMAAVPYGARYRLIDFPLSNLANAGVSSVGIVTKENYRSLMGHIGSGVSWDLDRKNGGIYLLSPYVTSEVKRYTGTVDALHGALHYLERCKAEYMVLCYGDTIANLDITAMVEAHMANRADITVAYHHGKAPVGNQETLLPVLAQDGRITRFDSVSDTEEVDFCMGVFVVARTLLMQIIKDAYAEGQLQFAGDVLAHLPDRLHIFGYEHTGFVAVMDSTDTYYQASMALLDPQIRSQLFNKRRPVFTKTRDDMPTRYGTRSAVENCLIADGCVINGTVKNSIVFRGVTVEKGAVVKNCILMQGTVVKKGTRLEYVVSDKNVVIREEMTLKGTPENRVFLEKNQTV
ncbi:MAG: glucose-1-phosphate adenylyltransferase subunit GlgD [Clostridia bacterium]|nr:glucose-1-phosphate adenylyltransferase subunit GlgD [Clostridia bacterium]